ncbi:TetR/AcrR family transcriptional regulator [Kribbella soli]|uniref:TetR/AcrR family transcriptional regulator n=1 Tax=Kribbella soli TaxID=1124743 RepID=A0A4R0HLH4_9ACTN|nr:TetR/AcrR family transcriptional regulator [Kribbella soli]
MEAAWGLVRDDGLAALSLRELAKRAGITTPTLYAYFESKNAILDAMFAQAAQSFVELMRSLPASDDPVADMIASVRNFADFCVSDVPRYQLLFQHSVPGFTPSPESYGIAVSALALARDLLARNGVHDPRHLDIWTAITAGLVDQQIANDPGGDRWTGLIEDVTEMFLAHYARGESTEYKGES